MTNEQKKMLENGPTHIDTLARDRKRKIVAITLGVIVGGTAAYFLAPKILGKIKARQVLKATQVI